MNKVFELARELGEALANSAEYARMQETENTAMNDPKVSELMGVYMEAKNNVEAVLATEEPDRTKLMALFSYKYEKRKKQ